jgi:hypothetical protein
MCDRGDAVSGLALVISFVSVCFTALAWRINYQKLRLDLYNRRFDVYSRTLDFYHAILEWQPTDSEKSSHSLQDSPKLEAAQRAFIKASREALFLFAEDSGIQKQLEQMHADTIGIIGAKRDLFPELHGQPEMIRSEHAKLEERMERINEAIPLLEKNLLRYLNFRAVGLR